MNEIKKFFNKLAIHWDEYEHTPFSKIESLINELDIKENSDVLDIACGTGIITGLLLKKSKHKTHAIDISNRMIKIAKNKFKGQKDIKFSVKNFYKLSSLKKYDYAIIYNAYPHFLEPRKLSKKLSQILNNDGRFAIVHSMSRKDLNKHHANLSKSLCRDIGPIKEEIKFFENEFNIIKSIEDDTKIILIGQLKKL